MDELLLIRMTQVLERLEILEKKISRDDQVIQFDKTKNTKLDDMAAREVSKFIESFYKRFNPFTNDTRKH